MPQVFSLGNCVLGLNFYFSITDPFRRPQSKMKYYHALVPLLSFLCCVDCEFVVGLVDRSDHRCHLEPFPWLPRGLPVVLDSND